MVKIKTATQFECVFRKKKKSRTSRLLKDTEGRKSFSILSMARTISSNTLLCRSALTTLTCQATTKRLWINVLYQRAVRGGNKTPRWSNFDWRVHSFYTPTLKRELTGLWSLVCSCMWLLYLSWLTLFPLQRILSHQAGTRHFPLQKKNRLQILRHSKGEFTQF